MNYSPLDDYFLGRGASPVRTADGSQYLLGCQCGEVGRWPLMATIEPKPFGYQWSHFHNPCREARDYGGLGPYRFEKAAYERAVAQLRQEFV